MATNGNTRRIIDHMSKHTMNVSLTAELERVVHGLVEKGMYGNQSEVIRAAIRLLDEHETERATKLEDLRRDVAIGVDQMVAGKYSEVSAEEFKARGRKRLLANGEQARPVE